jgi:UDP-2,3-diacylglucosamine pyrophosphatase LpxH
VIAAYRLLHPDLGFWIAGRMGNNLDYAAAHPEAVRAAAARQQAWATARLEADATLSAVVMGHTHHPAAVEVFPSRWYLNPGAWLDGHRYAVLDAHGAQLLQYR